MKNIFVKKLSLLFICMLFGLATVCLATSKVESVRLADMDLLNFDQEWAKAQKNMSLSCNSLKIGQQTFTHGVGTHAISYFQINLSGTAKRFQAYVGVDSESGNKGSVEFAG